MNECEWTRDACKRLEELGAKVRVIAGGNRFQGPGWPDRWITHKLWHGHLEFKGVSTALTTLQKLHIRDINLRQPGTAFVVRKTVTGGSIQDHDCRTLYEFVTCEQLLVGLHYLRTHYVNNAVEDRGYVSKTAL